MKTISRAKMDQNKTMEGQNTATEENKKSVISPAPSKSQVAMKSGENETGEAAASWLPNLQPLRVDGGQHFLGKSPSVSSGISH